jgi:hypothetical protein
LTNPKQATGTVTSVAVAGGSGLTSSGGPITSSGTITLAVGAGTGITVNADDVAVTYATQTDMETPSSIVKSVNPGIVQYHPGVAKSWIRFTISGTTLTVVASNNCSAARNGVGDYTMTFSSAFSSASAYVAVGGCWNASGSGNGTTHESAIAAGSYRVVFQDNAGGNVEATLGQFAFFGDY